MTCALVDAEDYPRGDIDLYKVRTARQKINCLQNDLNKLTKEINSGLEEHFAELKVSGKDQEEEKQKPKPEQSQGTSVQNTKTSNPPVNKEPFAVITEITTGSPAQDAGLRIKDEIVEFGSLHGKNYEALKQFADIAEHKLNKQVPVLVKRKDKSSETSFETIQLVPRKWSGRGHLGMMVKPL